MTNKPHSGDLTANHRVNTLLNQVSIWKLVQYTAIILVSFFVLVYILLPFYWMVKSSFQTNLETRAIPPIWLPTQFSFESYERANVIIPVLLYMKNSLLVSITTAVIATLIASMASYVLARYHFPLAIPILSIILLTQLIPAITRVFPIYFLMQDLGLLNTYVGLILAYTGFSVPYAVLLLRGYFKTSIPPEIEEAARIDGCTRFGIFRRIVLPISAPGIVAVGAFTFLGAWNDFLWASLLLNRGELKTIQVGLALFTTSIGGSVTNVNAFMAACVMATIPAMILFLLVQRWIVGGLSAGAVK